MQSQRQDKQMERLRTIYIPAVAIAMILLGSASVAQPEIRKIGPGSSETYSMGKNYPNPMAYPSSILERFNLPDTVDLSVCITYATGDTLLYKDFGQVTPGDYQFSWNFAALHVKPGVVIFELSAYRNQRGVFCGRVPATVLGS